MVERKETDIIMLMVRGTVNGGPGGGGERERFITTGLKTSDKIPAAQKLLRYIHKMEVLEKIHLSEWKTRIDMVVI